MIGLCCDSGAQLPDDLRRRHRIEVVPLTVTVDGEALLEGEQLDADAFWARYDGGRAPEVSTAAPSPGQFAAAYQRLADAGATRILSVHTGSAVSATFDAARLAAQQAPVPVELVDTGSASFVVGCATLAAAEAIAAGADVAAAAERARAVAASAGNVFVVGALDVARAGGRLGTGADAAPVDAIPVLRLQGGKMDVVGHAADVDSATAAMAEEILAAGPRLRVGLSVADPGARPLVDALRDRLESSGADLDVLEYRVGPSVGAHTGPGTAGAVFHPLG
ncbi:MAG: DegV family protein [Acidimicrobiia bacterium]